MENLVQLSTKKDGILKTKDFGEFVLIRIYLDTNFTFEKFTKYFCRPKITTEIRYELTNFNSLEHLHKEISYYLNCMNSFNALFRVRDTYIILYIVQ